MLISGAVFVNSEGMKEIGVLLLILIFPVVLFGQSDEDVLTFKKMHESGEYFKEGEEYYKKRKFEKAGDAFAKSFDILGTNGEAAYNAACAYSLANVKDKAIEYSEKALKAGIYDFEDEPDFFNIKGTNEFQDIVFRSKIMKEEVMNQSMEPIFIMPDGYTKSKKYPLIVAFHGFNSSPDNFSVIYKDVANELGCILMLSRGTKVIKKGSFAWTYEEEEYNRVLDEIEMAKLMHSVDPSKVILTGFAQGGFMAYALGLVKSQDFRGILPVAGLIPKNVSVSKMRNKDMKVFAIVGEKDSPKILSQNREGQKVFKQNNVPFKLKTFDIGHEYPPNRKEVLKEGLKWILS